MAIDYKEWNERKNLLHEYRWKFSRLGANGYTKLNEKCSIFYTVSSLKAMNRTEFEAAITEYGKGV